jgi:hypothetical protein
MEFSGDLMQKDTFMINSRDSMTFTALLSKEDLESINSDTEGYWGTRNFPFTCYHVKQDLITKLIYQDIKVLPEPKSSLAPNLTDIIII